MVLHGRRTAALAAVSAWLPVIVAAVAASLLLGPLAAPSRAGVVAGIVPDLPSTAAGADSSAGFLGPLAFAGAVFPSTVPVSASTITYQGGPVLHANRTHLIFWEPPGTNLAFDPGYIALVQQFFADVAAQSRTNRNEYGLTGQYTDGNGQALYASTYGGSVIDTDGLPASECTEPASGPRWNVCVTDGQLQWEVKWTIEQDHLPTAPDDIYFLLTPEGMGSCLDASSTSCALGGAANGYCGYHASTPAGILYAVIPYNAVPGHCQSSNPRPNANPADPTLSSLSHEQIETITDPFGNAWLDGDGDEIADLCLREFGRPLGGSGSTRYNELINGHRYWLQEIHSRLQDQCEQRPSPVTATIAGMDGVVAGSPSQLSARGSQHDGAVVAYRWSFGDGTIASGRTVMHSYADPGDYELQLRMTDSAGNFTFITRTMHVERPRAADRPTRRHTSGLGQRVSAG